MVDEIGYDLAGAWPACSRGSARRRVALEAESCPTPCGCGSRPRRPDVELVPAERVARGDAAATKTPDEVERIAAACAVADRALAALLPEIRPGVTEHDLALRLEWLIRTGGAEALAFDVACLAGPEAALPHGAPGDRPGARRRGPAVRLRRPGRGLPQRHDADAVRRRAAGARPRGVRRSSRAAQQAAASTRSRAARRRRRRCPDRRSRSTPRARAVIDGGGPVAGHTATASGHGIGLATHELPRLGRTPRPTSRCRARRCSPWSPASTSRARPACGSRTCPRSTGAPASSSR